MGRVGLAFRAFFKILFGKVAAEPIAALLAGESVAAPTAAPPQAAEPKPPAKKQAQGGAAFSLLAAMQREARLIDFIKEPIAAYTDAQIGAAVRDVHRGCNTVLERVFALRPIVEGEEGAAVEVPSGPEAARFRLVGNVTGQGPFRGTLCHHGWQATKIELPEWTGNEAAARIVAPAEVELK